MSELDKKLDESEPKDTYQEVAEEIVDVIKHDLIDPSKFDVGQITDVLRKRFNVKDESIGRTLISDVTLFNPDFGHTFTIPLFGLPIFSDAMPISGKCYPNYDIRNKYMGYTNNGVFHRVTEFGVFWGSVKRNPSVVLASIIAGLSVGYTLLHI